MPASFCYFQAYKASFTAALEAEHTEEWQLAEERLKTWPEQRLKVIAARYTCGARTIHLLTVDWHAAATSLCMESGLIL